MTAGWPSVTETKTGRAAHRPEERGADPQDGVHLIELTLVAELLGLLDDEAVEDLDDDVELDAEHADRQADGEARVRAQGHAVGGGDDGHRAVVGNRRAAEARDAELHELDGAADDEAGLPVAHDDAGDKAPEDGIVDEDHRDAVVVHVLDEGQQGQKDDLQDSEVDHDPSLDEVGDGDGLVGGHELCRHLDAAGDERLVALDVLGGGIGALGELDAALLDERAADDQRRELDARFDQVKDRLGLLAMTKTFSRSYLPAAKFLSAVARR